MDWTPPFHWPRALLLIAAVTLSLSGCVRSMWPGRDDGSTGSGTDMGQDAAPGMDLVAGNDGYTLADMPTFTPVDALLEAGADVGAAADKGPLPDAKPKLDLAKDQGGVSTKPGGKCPCGAGMLCVKNVCRALCKKPSDGCLAKSSCPATEGCIELQGISYWVCLPGVGAGASCGNAVGKPCNNGLVCVSVDSKPLKCLPVCSKSGAACGSGGGTCRTATGPGGTCLFCSKP